MQRRLARFVFVAAVLVLCALAIFTCTRRGSNGGLVSGKGGTRLVMGTFANVTAVARDQKTLSRSIEAAYAELVAADEMMSDYKPDSELSLVNRQAYQRPVKVSDPLFDVLRTSRRYSGLSNGGFDITVGPVVQLWRTMRDEGKLPPDDLLAAAKAKVGYDKLILDEQAKTVRFTVPGMLLDLGAIGKGYAVDRAVEAMQAAGARGGLVDLGGNIRCFGPSPNKTNVWRIGVDDPQGGADILMVLNLSDCAIATSGDYRQFATVDGKRYSHIIDPAAGASADQLTSATIIAPKAVDADALSTAVSVMGRDKGLQLIESLDKTEAIVIAKAAPLEFVKTSGAEAYIRK